MPEEEREKGMGSLYKQIDDENFLNLWKDLDPQIKEENRTCSYLNPKMPTLRHSALKP